MVILKSLIEEQIENRRQAERKEQLMKKGTYVGIVALVVAAVGVIIALAAYFKNRTTYLYDEDDFMFDDPENIDFYMDDSDDYFADEENLEEQQAPEETSDSEETSETQEVTE